MFLRNTAFFIRLTFCLHAAPFFQTGVELGACAAECCCILRADDVAYFSMPLLGAVCAVTVAELVKR